VTEGLNPKLVARLVALGLLTVIVQVAAVSQVHLFGVNADLLPVVVAAVGLLCGSLTGAVFGFCVGLFLDLALVQTVGLSSLLYVAVGYWSGRARELRDPQGPLVPIALGAIATAIAAVGYSLMQFLLGVDAPVTFVLVREILATILLNALIAGPVMALTRRVLLPVLPEDPRRRRRRRAYTTGGLSPLHRA
jgi:rod shape-determining protein MreD